MVSSMTLNRQKKLELLKEAYREILEMILLEHKERDKIKMIFYKTLINIIKSRSIPKRVFIERIKLSDLRREVIEKIDKKNVCDNCGCDDLRLLQIHHKNNDGGLERKLFGEGKSFYLKIINGERITNDLRILCVLCNWKEHLKSKYSIDYKIKVIK